MYHPGTAGAFPLPRALLCSLILTLLASTLASSVAQAGDRNDGLILQIPGTITTESVARLRSNLHGALKRFEQGHSAKGGTFVVLCDMNPEGRRSDSEDFGACYSLAKYLTDLSSDTKGVLTVAYVNGDVTRHSVLPVLACKEVILSPRGRLGQVIPSGKSLARVEQTAYEEIVKNRRGIEAVRRMFSPSEVGGQGALYDYTQATAAGLSQSTAARTLDEARLAYRLPRSSFRRSLDRLLAWRIPVEGAISGETLEKTRRRVNRAVANRATMIIFDLRCGGGDSTRAIELARYIASLQENPDRPLETVAYVSSGARDLAAFPALACSKIYMQRESDAADPNPDDDNDSAPGEARLGEFAAYLRRHEGLEDALADNLADIASKQFYPQAVARALARADAQVVLVEPATVAGPRVFLAREEYEKDKKTWRLLRQVKPWEGQARFEGKPLTLTATQAQQLEIATVVKNVAELYEVEGLVATDVRVTEADWLDGVADFLRDPWTSMVLIMVAITCLILELKMPGVGLPGVTSAICFVLFFWAHSQLHGQMTWLAILLFLLGLVLIGLEVFVLPGFGVCGISGVLLVLISLGLVAYGHWPQSSGEWVRFGNKLGPFGISLLGSLVGVSLIVRYLPHIPILNRLLLRPGGEDGDLHAEPELPMHAELQALLGAIGVAATPLRPAGKTQIGDEFIDVVAEGGYIMPGTRVQVIEVEGARVVVKQV